MDIAEIELNQKQRKEMQFLYNGWAEEQLHGYPSHRLIDGRILRALESRGLCESVEDNRHAKLTDVGLIWCENNLTLRPYCGLHEYVKLIKSGIPLEFAQEMRTVYYDQMRRQLPLDNDIPTGWYKFSEMIADTGWVSSMDKRRIERLVEPITYEELMDDELGAYRVIYQSP